jgi:lipopolysaccharide/colanic/teichoic acid biosynthesis glycosyltransferase
MIYPQVSEGILDVEQIVWRRQQALALARPRSFVAIIVAWVKKCLLDPILFLLISGVLLLAPQRLMLVFSHGRAQSLLRRMVIRSIDIVGAGVGLILALPFFLFVPLLIKLDSPGPVFYKQVRTGRDRRRRERRVAGLGAGLERRRGDQRQRNLFGKPFFIYKFRTMADGAERRSGAVWAIEDDPRITNVGRWLRIYHIDEIPQFWNILRGEMSLVGPRPERPEIISKLIAVMPEYRRRLYAKPGLTGLAQICLGYDSCLEDVKRKIQLDLLYISNPSLRLYLRILIQTVNKILSSTTIDVAHVIPDKFFAEELPVTEKELLNAV